MSGASNASGVTPLPQVAQLVIAADRFAPASMRLLPILDTPTKSGTYPVINLAQLRNDQVGLRAPGGVYAQTSMTLSSDTYTCEDYGSEILLDRAFRNQMEQDAQINDIRAILAGTKFDDLLLAHERRAAALLNAAAFTSTGATATFDNSNGVPVTDIRAAVRRLNGKGIRSNIFAAMTGTLFDQLLTNAQVKAYLSYTGTGIAGVTENDAALARLLGVSGIVLLDSYYNSAGKGQTASLSSIWTDSVCFVAQIAAGPFVNGGVGRTMLWTGDSPLPVVVEEYEHPNAIGTMIRARHNVDELITNVSACEKLTGCT